jgi:hypothetical protein
MVGVAREPKPDRAHQEKENQDLSHGTSEIVVRFHHGPDKGVLMARNAGSFLANKGERRLAAIARI